MKKNRIKTFGQKESDPLLNRIKRKKKELRKHKFNKVKAYFVLYLVILGTVLASAFYNYDMQLTASKKEENARARLDRDFVEDCARLDRDFWDRFYETVSTEQTGMETDSTVLNEKNRIELNQFISSLKRWPTHAVELKEKNGSAYYQYVQKNDIGEYTIVDAGNDIIFPGAIVKGDSLFRGTADYTLLAVKRTPINLVNTQIQDSSVPVNNVNYSTVSSALHGFEAKWDKKAPQSWNYYLKSLTSEHDVKLSFGVSVADLGLDLGYSKSKQSATVAVVYKQVYYSVNAEPLENAVDYFEDGTDLAGLGEYEPAYVSSVDYGRMFIVFVSGNMSSSELSAKLGACLNGVSVSAGLSNIVRDEELNVSIFQHGGKTGDTNKLFEGKKGKLGVMGHVKEFFYGSEGETDITQRINDFLEMDEDMINPQPLSYRLKYLSDNEMLPAIAIEREGIIPVEKAKTVIFNVPGNVVLNFSDNAGMMLEQEKTSEIMFLWNACFQEPVTGTLNGDSVALDLYSHKNQNDFVLKLSGDGYDFFGDNTFRIHIQDSVAEMP